ncbi:hypothetical protein RHSIM_Rhsim08G0234700 [Rhododendron simsii]|uniref:Nucleosome assembly protein n=1 Tax=Rhododendron simsii TaxID=118357 RepID=A0A834GP54_RHOSS|nr:hypothetical protein RHSIM_Rhsim08G0234700 [Rhododendron simsii]
MLQRYEIVNGVVEVEGVPNEATMNQEEDKEAGEKGVPSFWVTAMKTNEVLAEEISERDEEALKYLKDIKWFRIDDPKGFKLEFFFDPNPFFKNSVLTKTYHMIDDDEPILEKAIGSTIRDKIIPHAISWFTGEAAQDDEFEDIEEDDDEDEEGDEDEDDEDEDDEEEDEDEDDDGEKGKGRKKSSEQKYAVLWDNMIWNCKIAEDWQSTSSGRSAGGAPSRMQATVAVSGCRLHQYWN